MKKISKMVIAALLLTSAAMSCPNWDGDVSYSSGDKITYNGVNYVAARTVPANTAPNAADNGWFWTETTETCETNAAASTALTADKFSVNFGRFATTNQVEMNRSGVSVKYFYPVGGGQNTSITSNSVAIEQVTSMDTLNTTLESTGLVLNSKVMGNSGFEVNSTTVNASEISTTGKILVGAPQGLSAKTAITSEGVDVVSSFGTVKINDRGIETNQSVTARFIVANGVNISQKIAELEARIAELEAK